jgi:hypothetical protein
MANLTETPVYESGIYQIETTDPVVGGANGISNLPLKQLANRTAYLKQFADEVVNARANKANLAERLAQYDAYSPDQQTDIIAGMLSGLNLAGVLAKEIDKFKKIIFAQGTAVLKNKYVIQGFVLTKSDIRALHLSQTGTVGTGISKAYIDGLIISLADDDYHVVIPTNEDNYAKTYYAYLLKQTDGTYRVSISQTVPDTAMSIYIISIPAFDTANNLNNVTLTDIRTIQSYDGWLISSKPFIYITLPYAMPDAEYAVDIEVTSATNIDAVGTLKVYNKATNGFKIEMSGSADNVSLIWTLHYPSYE